ncbi:MAG: TonB-dependent receptor [Kordiimonadaceae bacterium]|nr:TonB-dependent receptor [Kordiimonadaceae bacterium]
MINYEIGAKTSSDDGRFTLNGAIFMMDWSNVQVNYDPSGFGFPTVFNAEKARSQGFEIESTAYLTDALKINISAAYTDATLNEDVIFPSGAVAFLAGSRLAQIPEFTFNAGVEYNVAVGDSLDGTFRANYSHISESVKDPTETAADIAPGYGIANASFTIASENGWKAKLFVTNIADKHAAIFNTSRAEFTTIRPRTIGLNATFDF